MNETIYVVKTGFVQVFYDFKVCKNNFLIVKTKFKGNKLK
jgi:hypothetical protein